MHFRVILSRLLLVYFVVAFVIWHFSHYRVIHIIKAFVNWLCTLIYQTPLQLLSEPETSTCRPFASSRRRSSAMTPHQFQIPSILNLRPPRTSTKIKLEEDTRDTGEWKRLHLWILGCGGEVMGRVEVVVPRATCSTLACDGITIRATSQPCSMNSSRRNPLSMWRWPVRIASWKLTG